MDFYKRLELVCEKIPYGKVTTYGQLAMLCGKPKNARQVGYALNRGLAGENFPAHRVIGSSGYLNGAAAFDYPELQKMLLIEEGIPVEWSPKGCKVDLKKYGWKNTMEEAEGLRQKFGEMGI